MHGAALDLIFATIAPGVGAAERTPGPDRRERDYGGGRIPPLRVARGRPLRQDGPQRIERGLMAAYAEGLDVLKHANVGADEREADARPRRCGTPRYYRYDLNIPEIIEVAPRERGGVVAARPDGRSHIRGPGAVVVRRARVGFGRGPGKDGARRGGRGRAGTCSRRRCSTGSSHEVRRTANKILSAMRKQFGARRKEVIGVGFWRYASSTSGDGRCEALFEGGNSVRRWRRRSDKRDSTPRTRAGGHGTALDGSWTVQYG